MFLLMNERGDAGESRNSLATQSRLIGVSVVIANVEGPGLLAESRTSVRELNEKGGGAGVLADSGNSRGSEGRLGVEARV